MIKLRQTTRGIILDHFYCNLPQPTVTHCTHSSFLSVTSILRLVIHEYKTSVKLYSTLLLKTCNDSY